MCYYSPSRTAHIAQQRGQPVSPLVNFIQHRMKQLGKSQSQIADDSDVSRGVLSNIMTKEAKGGKPVRPEPETIRKLAVGLEVHPSLLTSLLGYPTDPIPGIDEPVYELAKRIIGAPWLADRIDDFLDLPRSEFDELMNHLDYRRSRRSALPHRNGDQSNP